MKRIRKYLVVVFIIIIVIFITYITKVNSKYYQMMKYITDETGIYHDFRYNYDNNDNYLEIFLYSKITEYEKIAQKANYYLDEYVCDKSLKVNIYFIEHNKNEVYFIISNFPTDDIAHEKFDTIKILEDGDGFYFDRLTFSGEKYFNDFKRLEIGKGYAFDDLKWITHYFRELDIITCYVKDEKEFNRYCDFVHDFMSDCEVINLQTELI